VFLVQQRTAIGLSDIEKEWKLPSGSPSTEPKKHLWKKDWFILLTTEPAFPNMPCACSAHQLHLIIN
jgi:hypothetical protein